MFSSIRGKLKDNGDVSVLPIRHNKLERTGSENYLSVMPIPKQENESSEKYRWISVQEVIHTFEACCRIRAVANDIGFRQTTPYSSPEIATHFQKSSEEKKQVLKENAAYTLKLTKRHIEVLVDFETWQTLMEKWVDSYFQHIEKNIKDCFEIIGELEKEKKQTSETMSIHSYEDAFNDSAIKDLYKTLNNLNKIERKLLMLKELIEKVEQSDNLKEGKTLVYEFQKQQIKIMQQEFEEINLSKILNECVTTHNNIICGPLFFKLQEDVESLHKRVEKSLSNNGTSPKGVRANQAKLGNQFERELRNLVPIDNIVALAFESTSVLQSLKLDQVVFGGLKIGDRPPWLTHKSIEIKRLQKQHDELSLDFPGKISSAKMSIRQFRKSLNDIQSLAEKALAQIGLMPSISPTN